MKHRQVGGSSSAYLSIVYLNNEIFRMLISDAEYSHSAEFFDFCFGTRASSSMSDGFPIGFGEQ